jgi:ribosomal protein S18 acetylase RimI-like enzyme
MDGSAARRENASVFQISNVSGAADLEQARTLFREYVAEVDAPCCFATFDREMALLPGEYALPDGRLLVARNGAAAAGCVAMRRLEAGGEMKRLYVRGPFRSSGLGRELAQRVISAAREQRYGSVLLDTLPSMREAIALYRSLGFRERGPYSADPTPGALYFEFRLS